MNRYIDIHIKADPEFPEATLMSALFSKLHRALVGQNETGIGVSFPRHALKPKRTLGPILRLHGNQEALQTLMATPWLSGMRDHAAISEIRAVPDNCAHRPVRRRQFKTNVERLRRRRAKRQGETLEQARQHIPDNAAHKVTLPSLTLYSRSTGQSFSLFIEHGPIQPHPVEGTFNSYGLSRKATIPWF